jgi:hypothetical protein
LRFGALTTASVLALLTAASGTASAQEGRCAAVLGAGFQWEPGVLDSVDPAELESPDPDVQEAEAPLPVRGVLLCARPDDVRCQPLQPSDAPTAPRLASAGPDAVVTVAALSIDPSFLAPPDVFGETALLGAGRDVTSELLRPPRG